MARRKNKTFMISGIHGELEVTVCTRRTLIKYAGHIEKGMVINGLYQESEHRILIASELGPHARITTLYHELAHHIFDTAQGVEEERACDLVGGYMQRLVASPEFLDVLNQISVC